MTRTNHNGHVPSARPAPHSDLPVSGSGTDFAALERLGDAYLTARAAYTNTSGTNFTAAYTAYGAQLDAFRAATPIDVVLSLLSARRVAEQRLTAVSHALESLVDPAMAHDDPARAASIVAEMVAEARACLDDERAMSALRLGRADVAEHRLDWLLGYPRADIGARGAEIMRRWDAAHPNGGVITRDSLNAAIDAAREAVASRSPQSETRDETTTG